MDNINTKEFNFSLSQVMGNSKIKQGSLHNQSIDNSNQIFQQQFINDLPFNSGNKEYKLFEPCVFNQENIISEKSNRPISKIQPNKLDDYPHLNQINTMKKDKKSGNNKGNKIKKKDQIQVPVKLLEDHVFLKKLVEDDDQDQEIEEDQQEEIINKEESQVQENSKSKQSKQHDQSKKDQFEDFLDNFVDENRQDDIQDNFQNFNFYENIDKILDFTEQFVQDEFASDGNEEILDPSFQNPNFNLQQTSTFSLQDYLKTTILDHYFNGDSSFVKEKLNDTIMQVYTYIESLIPDKQSQIKEFEKKLKKFIFDYRYDQYHQPRKYSQQSSKSAQNLKQKFQDPKFDQRKIQYEIQDYKKNPFSLFCNEIDVYVQSFSNELSIKQAFYSELEQYLKAVFQEKCDIQSNYYCERRIYHQCINFTFKDTKLTLKIRVQTQASNLFKARDKIVESFYKYKETELNIFASFTLYWAQKRKIISSQVMDKNAWTNLILYFFQINHRLPPPINYDILKMQAHNIEVKCYQQANDNILKEKYSQEQSYSRNNSQVQNEKKPLEKLSQQQQEQQRHNSKLQFDFALFDKLNSQKLNSFLVQLTPPESKNSNMKVNQEQLAFKVLPLIQPSPSNLFKVREAPNFNYGFFFYKFLYFLNFQIVVDPIAVSLSGEIKTKKKNSYNENIEPIAIQDTIWTDINIVSHLSYSQDAFTHLINEIKIAYQTIYENKMEKIFLGDIATPNFNMKKQKFN